MYLGYGGLRLHFHGITIDDIVVSVYTVILKSSRASVGWVWLARLSDVCHTVTILDVVHRSVQQPASPRCYINLPFTEPFFSLCDIISDVTATCNHAHCQFIVYRQK